MALQYAKSGDNSHHTNDKVSCGAVNFYRNNEKKKRHYQYTNKVVQWISANISKKNPCILFLSYIKIFYLSLFLFMSLFAILPYSSSLDLFRSIYPAVVETSQSRDFFRVHLPFLLFHMLTFNINFFPHCQSRFIFSSVKYVCVLRMLSALMNAIIIIVNSVLF